MSNTAMTERLFDGDTFEYRGLSFKVEFPGDDTMGAPWEEHDGHGEVSIWTARDKRPGELVLARDGGLCRYYDFAGAVKTALKDGWDAPPYKTGTKKQTAERAAKADFEYLRGWCADEWHWCGAVVTLLDEDGEETDKSESAWGIEDSESDYLAETAYELAGQIAGTVEEASAVAADYAAVLASGNYC